MGNLHRKRAFASFFTYFSERMPIASRSSSSMPLLLQLSTQVLHFHFLLQKKSRNAETMLCHAMARGTARGRGRAQTDVTSRLRSFVAPRADNGASKLPPRCRTPRHTHQHALLSALRHRNRYLFSTYRAYFKWHDQCKAVTAIF